MNTSPKLHLTAILLLSVLLISGCNRAVRQKTDAQPQNTDPAPIATNDSTANPNDAVNAPGRHDHTLMVGEETREFIVYVPQLADAAAKAPVVVMLHGTSGTGSEFFDKSGWREKADKEGFVAVFPTAMAHCYFEDETRDGDFDDPGEKKVYTKWSAGNLGGDRLPLCTQEDIAALEPNRRALADHPLAVDMAYFHSLFDFLEANYSIDSKRIYVTGFSSGGQMAGRLAVEMSERIAAASSHAAPLSFEGTSSRPIPVILTYGNQDDRITPYNDGNPFPLDEALIQNPWVKAGLVDRWLVALQLADVYEYSEGIISGERYARFTFATSLVGAENSFQLIFIDNLGHEYPNGINHPVIAANILWEFFTQFQLP